jgi:hypothetical protein
MKDFHGYARDCIGESIVCWELGTPKTNQQFKYFEEQDRYWKLWDEAPGPWPPLQKKLLAAYGEHFGEETKYFAIDGGNWPPKAIALFDKPKFIVLATLGVSLRPQPKVEIATKTPGKYRRIELGICIAKPVDEPYLMLIASYLSGQTNLPWTNFTYLDDGHTIPADVFDRLFTGGDGAVLLQNEVKNRPAIQMPSFFGDPIRLHWLTPISSAERQLAMSQGSSALVKRMEQAGIDWHVRLQRKSVV